VQIVVMAAGLGSRFGGPKQLAPVGPSGETLIDYVLFDARRAGFIGAIIVVRDELAEATEPIAERHRHRIAVALARQETGPAVPRGTVPAVLAAAPRIDGPFAVLNADDFYGAEAYRRAAEFLLSGGGSASTHAVVTFPLAATLSPHGAVVRAVCRTDGQLLAGLDEVPGIERRGDAIVAGERRFTGSERVSMNLWAFRRGMLADLAAQFERFRRDHDAQHELLLPVAIDASIGAGRARVRVLEASGPWFGLTHASDLPVARAALAGAATRGEYPTPLWTPEQSAIAT
jgi:NDP-sugar pyrophosphorylase family protein